MISKRHVSLLLLAVVQLACMQIVCLHFASAVLAFQSGTGNSIDPLKTREGILVDFDPDNGRSDIRTKLAKQWVIPTGKSETALSIGGLDCSLRIFQPEASMGSPSEKANVKRDGLLAWGWWKAGYDFAATLASDGVTTSENGDVIELSIRGLSPGHHSLTTWHNSWESGGAIGEASLGQSNLVELFVENAGSRNLKDPVSQATVQPSLQVTHDDLAATACLEFETKADQVVIVRVRPASAEARVVLNGFAIDRPDPARTIRVPQPSHQDQHVAAKLVLSWLPPRVVDSTSKQLTTVKYHVYLGSDEEQIYGATLRSPEYQGATTSASWPTDAVDFLKDTYWRVDCEFADGKTIVGRVFSFRIRQDAFPGAEGYGRFAIGGRGGRVIAVTNLNDSGDGSLREAVEAEGPRTVVFRVSGTIQLKSKLLIRNPYITIAGQTAPGDGICVRGYTFGCFGAHDVIMRYLRLRVGDESGSTMDGTGFASSDHCIFDHCSVSWSIDEAVSSRSAKNITLQRCIVAEALNVANHQKYKEGSGHSFAGSISGDIGSFHHNLVAHCAGRNWSLAGGLNRGGKFAGRLDIRNNVVYNWEYRTNDGGVKALNLINNLYIPGPATRVFHLLKPDAGSPQDRQQYFVAGNRMEGKFDESGDNWADAVKVQPELLDEIRLNEPFCQPLCTTHSVDELLENVLSDVGANRVGLDLVDQRIVSDVRNRTASSKGSKAGLPGIIDSQRDVGGWPELKSTSPPSDQDQDGLPDAWELSHGLNPKLADQNKIISEASAPSKDSTNSKTQSSDGVTALEMYLAELAQR